jgi:hypothetical protein
VAIQVGSVEVDVIPNTQNIYARLRAGLVPAATRAGDDAGQAAGRSFGPAMQREVGGIGLAIGQQIGQQIATRITAEIRGAMRDGVNQGGAQARASAVRQGDQTGGAFSRAMKTRLEAAFRSLPKINIDANTSEADADLQALRVRMETLANKRIGIDIDAGAAKAEIKLIEAELRRLGSSHPNIQVRADTATALGELAAVRAAMAAVDGNRVRVNVDTSGALSAILHLGVAIAGLAAIPAIPVLAAGIGSIAAAGVAAAAGVGALAAVAAPAFKDITGALQAQKKAQDALTKAQDGTAASQKAATETQAAYQRELAKMTPAARGTFNAFTSLRTAFGAWSKSLQPAVMPLFTRALNGIKNSLPGLTPFVLAAAKAIGILQDRASRGFKSPWWQSFKKDLAGAVVPAIVGLGASFGRIFKGMAGIVQAFLPHMDSISATMQRITGRFAKWGTSLKGSEKFEGFLAYSSKQAPVLAKAIGDIGSAFYQIARASAPLSGPVLVALGAVASAIASIAESLPWLIQLFYLAWIATKLWTLSLIIFNAVMAANPITLIIIGIIALVAAVIYAYKNFGWFRDLVQAVWKGIQTAALWAWNNVLKPVFNGIWTALKTVGKWATWLWKNILSPVFSAIGLAAKILAVIVLTILITPFVLAFKVLGAIAKWLWNNAIGPAFRAIGKAGVWLWNTVLKPAFNSIMAGIRALAAVGQWLWRNIFRPVFQFIGDKAKWLWEKAVKPAFALFKLGIQSLSDKAKWLWNKALRPVFTWIGDKGRWLWNKALKPAFDNIKRAVRLVGDSFGKAKDAIKLAWDKISGIAKKPVRFVIDKIYNAGIVPVWNLIAGAFGAPKIKKMETKGWATGGVLPGYTPGKDVHKFFSPTGGGLELSGGEAIMRPEFTRGAGRGFIATMNKIASSRGATGVKAALAPALGGNPRTPTQRFADGGIFGWIAKTTAGAGSKAWEGIKKTTGWLKDGLEASARAGVKHAVDPLLKKFPGADTGFGKMLRRIPTRMLDAIFGYGKEADKKGGGGIGGPKIQAALKWAKTQHGLPYQWGGNGNPSWDCSGFLSAIESKIRGQKPHRRWATGAFSGRTAPPGWVLNGKSPFTIGITNAGVGHTAGTLGGVNVECRGGDGVVVGKRARGAQAMDFTHVYGFQPGKYDAGGYLQPGLNLAYNGTGRPEPVFTSQQANALSRMAGESGLGDLSVSVFVGDREITDIARTEVWRSNGELLSTLLAGRKG